MVFRKALFFIAPYSSVILFSNFVVFKCVLPGCPFVFSLSDWHGELLNTLQSSTVHIYVKT